MPGAPCTLLVMESAYLAEVIDLHGEQPVARGEIGEVGDDALPAGLAADSLSHRATWSASRPRLPHGWAVMRWCCGEGFWAASTTCCWCAA